MKLVALILTLVGLTAWRVHRWSQRRYLSDGWWRDQGRSECRQGDDLPRWRFPSELKEQARQARIARIADARARQAAGRRWA
jgi:hypothetical protein